MHVTFGPDGVSTGGGGKLRADFSISRWFKRSPNGAGAGGTAARSDGQ